MAATAAPEGAELPIVGRPAAVLVLVSAAHATTHIYAALFPLVYPVIQREWGVPYAVLGAMIGGTSFAGGLLQLLFGFVGRSFPRNIVLGLGSLFLGVSTGLTGFTTGFAQFTILRFAAAVASAAQHPVGNSMIADRFPRGRRGSALAVNYAGGNIGTLLVPLAAVTLIGAVGWQSTLWLFAIPGVAMGVLLMLAVEDSDRVSDNAVERGSARSQIRTLLGYQNVLVLIGASSIAAGGRGLGVLFTFVPLYLVNGLGLTPAAVGTLYTIMLVGSVVGPMAAGQLSDRYGRKAILLGSLALSTATTVVLASTDAPEISFLGLLFFFMGAFVFAESPLIQSFLADSVPSGQRDLLFGFYFAWVYGVGALWVSFIGALIDRAGFGPAWWVVAGSYVGAALLVLNSREGTRSPR